MAVPVGAGETSGLLLVESGADDEGAAQAAIPVAAMRIPTAPSPVRIQVGERRPRRTSHRELRRLTAHAP
jgi:hypothetical protein